VSWHFWQRLVAGEIHEQLSADYEQLWQAGQYTLTGRQAVAKRKPGGTPPACDSDSDLNSFDVPLLSGGRRWPAKRTGAKAKDDPPQFALESLNAVIGRTLRAMLYQGGQGKIKRAIFGGCVVIAPDEPCLDRLSPYLAKLSKALRAILRLGVAALHSRDEVAPCPIYRFINDGICWAWWLVCHSCFSSGKVRPIEGKIAFFFCYEIRVEFLAHRIQSVVARPNGMHQAVASLFFRIACGLVVYQVGIIKVITRVALPLP
jgi:hypothetical protein